VDAYTLPVYVIHWNAPQWCASSVRSLLSSTGLNVLITVIDNGQEVGPPVAELLPLGVRFIRNPRNVGYAGAANVAWRDASGQGAQYFAVLAHDVIVAPDCLYHLLVALASRPGHGIVGPVFYDADLKNPTSTGGLWTGYGATHRIWLPTGSNGEVLEADWLHGALLLIRTACLDQIRGFREDFFAYVEDVDVCLRARKAGWKVGVATKARAKELGHILPIRDHTYLITRNTLLLLRTQAPAYRFWLALVRKVRDASKAALASYLPWRSPARRRLSRQFAVAQSRAILDALLGRAGPGGDLP